MCQDLGQQKHDEISEIDRTWRPRLRQASGGGALRGRAEAAGREADGALLLSLLLVVVVVVVVAIIYFTLLILT